MVRFRAQIEYDGTNYYGFQRQRSGFPTIQSELERALGRLAGEPVPITGAGRTDSGVHALGQVVSFTIEWRHGLGALQRALNANLPADIAIRNVTEAPAEFHPRYDARCRTYRYYVDNGPVRSPLRRLTSWHVAGQFDLEEMNRAAATLLGVHDFATFGTAPQGEVTTREVFAAAWRCEGGFLIFTIAANAFLYRMVRSLVGSLVEVGRASWGIADFESAFQACDRDRSAAAAPPQGLYLVSVTYEE